MTLLELIYRIPENLGWTLVGIAGTLFGLVLIQLARIAFLVYKYHKEEKALEKIECND